MTESLDPEEVASVMNSIKTEAVRIVEAHGGIVNQFVGDQIVSLFGIPTAHTDDARRAIAAALQIHDFVRNIVQGADEDARGALRMHTGVQSGVVVAELRNRLDGVYGLTGDPINTAARLLGLAEADQVLIGEATRAQVDQYFETRHGGDHAVKGKAQDLGTYVVVGPRADEVSFDPAHARGLTPWTGRADELAWLRDALESAIAGRGQVIAVEAEAGAGKSRLCHEFLANIARERAAVFTGRCQSYGYVIPYLPFVEVLRSSLGLQEKQSGESVTDRTVAGIRELGPSLEQHLPFYLQLLSASSPDHPPQRGVSPDDVPRLIQESIVAFIQALSARRPLALFLDDCTGPMKPPGPR
jgi:class 3 adenylate cyclase